MKKVISLLLVVVPCLALAACGSPVPEGDTSGAEGEETSQPPIPVFDLTAEAISQQFNIRTAELDSDLRLTHIDEINKYLTDLPSNTPNITLSLHTVDDKVNTIIVKGRGDGSVESGLDIYIAIFVSIGIADASLSQDDINEIALGLLDGSAQSPVIKNDIEYSVDISSDTWFVIVKL